MKITIIPVYFATFAILTAAPERLSWGPNIIGGLKKYKIEQEFRDVALEGNNDTLLIINTSNDFQKCFAGITLKFSQDGQIEKISPLFTRDPANTKVIAGVILPCLRRKEIGFSETWFLYKQMYSTSPNKGVACSFAKHMRSEQRVFDQKFPLRECRLYVESILGLLPKLADKKSEWIKPDKEGDFIDFSRLYEIMMLLYPNDLTI